MIFPRTVLFLAVAAVVAALAAGPVFGQPGDAGPSPLGGPGSPEGQALASDPLLADGDERDARPRPVLDPSLLGEYRLEIFQNSGPGKDHLILREVRPGVVIGELGLDWSLGPEARAPQPHEVFHHVPFKADVEEEGRSIEFSVTVAERQEFDFELSLATWEGQPALAGTVEITQIYPPLPPGTPRSSKEFGVIAIKQGKP